MPILPRGEACPQSASTTWSAADDAELDMLALAIAVDVLREHR